VKSCDSEKIVMAFKYRGDTDFGKFFAPLNRLGELLLTCVPHLSGYAAQCRDKIFG